MSLIGGAALTVVVAQLVLTAIFQFAPFKSRLLRLDSVGALPRWRFFVPGDVGFDHEIAVRGRRADGTLGDWRTVWTMPARAPWRWIWSPDRNDDRIVWFAAALLDRRIAQGREATPETSHAYATILRRCGLLFRSEEAFEAHQFALVRIDRGGERRTSFVSPFHAP